MYDQSQSGKRFRLLTFNSLAWWHSYKAAFMKLYNRFANEFIAPLFHHLYPGGWFFPKPKHFSNVVLMFVRIRLAYDTFKPDLAKALAKEGVKPENRCHLQNMLTMCEYLIPSVHTFHYIYI